jgi:hypothetical protein
VFLSARVAHGWLYPEHHEITERALHELDPGRAAVFDRLWAGARSGHPARLCERTAARTDAAPSCLEWAAWPAIAGDHSCSPSELVDIVLETRWILEVAAVAAHLEDDLAAARSRSQRINALRGSDIRLQRADPAYATRAGSNNVHFLLARPSVKTEGRAYLEGCLAAQAEPNAVGAYAWYHRSALEKAARLAGVGAAGSEGSALALATLADEAFALHFLEDGFAAGHVAGTWGPSAVRKGTHDYYNERGLERSTWDGVPLVITGDAYLRPEDERRVAEAVRTSLEQVLDAADGHLALPPDRAGVVAPDGLNVCQLTKMPTHAAEATAIRLSAEVLRQLPVPALAEGTGALPRVRAEIGPFMGVSAAALGAWISGGFDSTQKSMGAIGSLEAALRLGFGLEGVMDETGDGLVFVDGGVRQDTATSNAFSEVPGLADAGAITAAIPARTGFTVRVRMPFWLVPGDLLLAAPFVAPLSLKTYKRMAVIAGNGGLIPWQSGLATPIGRFQFVLGREVGVAFYGYVRRKDRLLVPPADAGGSLARLVALRSLALDLPVLEYRPFRSFSLNQASILVVQAYAGFDAPGAVEVIAPATAPLPEVSTIFRFGVRLAFDWRHY